MPRNFHKGRNSSRRTDRFVESTTSNQPSERNSYNQHDHRNPTRQHNVKGSVKSGRINRNRSRPLDTGRLQRAIEQEDDMAGSSTNTDQHRRYAPYKVGGGKRNQDARQHKSQRGTSSWSKVVITSGKRYEKAFLLKTLLNASKTPFVPIYYHIEGNHAVFYVEDAAAADSLSLLSKQITLHDGFQLILIVKWSPAPSFPLNEEVKDKIKLVMSRRYDPLTKTLNLSQFHLDEELVTDYYTPLSRENVLQTVVQIVGENIPDVQAIDASNNKIHAVDQMKHLITKTPALKLLNLGQNRIGQITTLDCLQGLPIEELILNLNPLCDRFADQATYISAVRKRFPKLVKLDGVDLPPVISFDIGTEDVSLPLSQGSWFMADDARRIVLAFLEQYLSVYDSDDRQPLLNAYHDSALMSLSCSYPPQTTNSSSTRLDSYLKESRNLKRVEDTQRRFRLLQLGKLDIVSFLAKLPKTIHDPRSLVVDVPVASTHLIVASVTGVFQERGDRQSLARWFQRVFVIIPNSAGFCIVNEQLHITSATPEQVKATFKEPAELPVVAPVHHLPSAVPEIANETIADPAIKEQMILSFAEQSGMNTEWSTKCLEENGWDFDRAAYVFNELKKNNQIPPEAFLK